jgi:hypothetical protein
LAKLWADIQAKRTILLKYPPIQTLQSTGLQIRILEAITPEKIEGASLLDLANSFRILKEAELGLKGEPFTNHRLTRISPWDLERGSG